MRSEHQGRGPRGCRRSDDCIREDVHDRLTDDRLDASDIEVIVENGEVTLSDTVASRFDRQAEDIAERVIGSSEVATIEAMIAIPISRSFAIITSPGSSP